MILEQIVAAKREEVEHLKTSHSLTELRERAAGALPPRDFFRVLRRDGPRVKLIAEIKRASPSCGVIRSDFCPLSLARDYEQAGAAALSILTEVRFFQGDPGYLAGVRTVTGLPLLRKDFIIDPVQIYEARLLGADAVLLIATLLEQEQLAIFLDLTRELGMSALVEVHTPAELSRVLKTDARIIGINNRNLRTFNTDLTTTFDLLPAIPAGRVVVSESGIRTFHDVTKLAQAGVDAVLIGEAFLRSRDVVAEAGKLMGVRGYG